MRKTLALLILLLLGCFETLPVWAISQSECQGPTNGGSCVISSECPPLQDKGFCDGPPGIVCCVTTKKQDDACKALEGQCIFGTTCPENSEKKGMCGLNVCCKVHASPSVTIGSGQADTIPAIPPNLLIPIPGLSFAGGLVAQNGYFTIPYLAQYISAVYRYLVGISVVVAAIMIIYGGFLYILGGTVSTAITGRKIISDALLGLVLVFSSYMILYTVNPATTTLSGIKILSAKSQETTFMENGPGFGSNPDNHDPIPVPTHGNQSAPVDPANNGDTVQITPPQDPSTPPGIEEVDGLKGGVSIAGIESENGTPDQILSKYCTRPDQISSLDTYDKKITALVRAILAYKYVCINKKGCAYVREGRTNLDTGQVSASFNIIDTPFFLSNPGIQFGGLPPDWVSKCAEDWDKKISDQLSADNVEKFNEAAKSYGITAANASPHIAFYNQSLWGAFPSIFKTYTLGGECQQILAKKYKEVVTDEMTKKGMDGGDCGTQISQMYLCAGGRVSRPGVHPLFNYINNSYISNNTTKKPEGRDIIVWYAKDQDDLMRQARDAGGLKFGDIVITGKYGKTNHNYMYTGGRLDVPFDTFEMGGGGTADNAGGFQVPISNGLQLTGMQTRGTGGKRWDDPSNGLFKYLAEYAKPNCNTFLKNKETNNYKYCLTLKGGAWPVSIFRPFDYDPCNSKNECKDSEVCLCTIRDCTDINKRQVCDFTKDTCNAAHTCRKITGAALGQQCKNSENCAKGYSCSCDKAGTFCNCKKDGT